MDETPASEDIPAGRGKSHRDEAENAPIYKAMLRGADGRFARGAKARPKGRTLELGAGERDFGCIATLVGPDGHRRQIHRPGGSIQAVRDICDEIDGSEWRIAVLSTPVTVYRDLQGTRVDEGAGPATCHIGWPESQLLGRVGRLDLWAGAPVTHEMPVDLLKRVRKRG